MYTIRSISPLAGLALILGGLGAAPTLGAQLNSNQAQVQLLAQPFAEALTVSVSPGVINFTLSTFAASDGDAPLQTTIDLTLDPNRASTQVGLYFYFVDPAAALINGASTIASSRVLGSLDGRPFEAFQGTSPFSSGASARGFIFNLGHPTTLNFQMLLRIDGSGLSLLPSTYAGTLFIQAQVL